MADAKENPFGYGEKMKILFLTPRDSKTNLGGVERHVKLLTEELERRGHQVKELSLGEMDKSYKDYKNYKEREKTKKDKKDRKGEGNFKFRAWKYLWEKRELLGWAEVIHVHDVFWWVLPFVPIIYYKSFKESPCHSARRHLKRKIFVTFHGWEGKCPPTWVAVWQKRLAKFLSDGTIGVGSFFEKWYGVKTDKVVWGVLDKNYKDYKEKEKGEKDQKDQEDKKEKGNAAFFGRLEEVNGIGIVIEAIKLMRALKVRPRRTSGSDLSFVFVGEGSWREQAEQVGEVTGMVENPWKYLVDTEVVIASSYLAILEAAAMGKRIIAVANNPLKRDYLEGHPLGRYFKVVGSAEELVREKGEEEKEKKDQKEQRGEGKAGEGNTWALGQTAEKLADEYLELWQSYD